MNLQCIQTPGVSVPQKVRRREILDASHRTVCCVHCERVGFSELASGNVAIVLHDSFIHDTVIFIWDFLFYFFFSPLFSLVHLSHVGHIIY